MAEAHNQTQILFDNLIDADCDEVLTQECMALAQSHKEMQIIQKLTDHRGFLLNKIHKSQKALDCLDYLIFQLRKNINQ